MTDENKEKSSTPLQLSASANIEDILGAGKGITKLFEMIERAFGRATKSFFIRKDADARAYELRKIAEAIGESPKVLGNVEYKNEGLTISAQGQPEASPPEPTLEDRARARFAYQQARKQINAESVTQNAAEELLNNPDVSDEKVDENWANRFFNIIEEISSEQVQQLWGKVLAGEVAKPGSYSLRTLEVLKNITQQEAELFVKVSQAVISRLDGSAFLPAVGDFNSYYERFGFTFDALIKLDEAGLIGKTELVFTNTLSQQSSGKIFFYGNLAMVAHPLEIPCTFNSRHYALTSAGTELLSLVEITPDIKHLREFASSCQQGTLKFMYSDKFKVDGSKVHFRRLSDLFSG